MSVPIGDIVTDTIILNTTSSTHHRSVCPFEETEQTGEHRQNKAASLLNKTCYVIYVVRWCVGLTLAICANVKVSVQVFDQNGIHTLEVVTRIIRSITIILGNVMWSMRITDMSSINGKLFFNLHFFLSL